jgi:tRNA pseudouridine55 synthase
MRSGVLLIDKPAGLTSHDATHALSMKLREKAGHTGTLDRFATGLLIVCLGRATRLSRYLTKLDKTYEALAVLGRTTDTYDREGATVSSSDLVPTAGDVSALAAALTGRIVQAPPPYSAKKIGGRRASDYARRGIEVSVGPVEVRIHSLSVLDYGYPRLRLAVACSSGTYVRSLVKDLGDRLACGAYTEELRRTGIGRFSVDGALPLREALAMSPPEMEKRIIPGTEALDFLPAVTLTEEEGRHFMSGRSLSCPAAGDRFRVLGKEGGFIGVGRKEEQLLRPETILGAWEEIT